MSSFRLSHCKNLPNLLTAVAYAYHLSPPGHAKSLQSVAGTATPHIHTQRRAVTLHNIHQITKDKALQNIIYNP